MHIYRLQRSVIFKKKIIIFWNVTCVYTIGMYKLLTDIIILRTPNNRNVCPCLIKNLLNRKYRSEYVRILSGTYLYVQLYEKSCMEHCFGDKSKNEINRIKISRWSLEEH